MICDCVFVWIFSDGSQPPNAAYYWCVLRERTEIGMILNWIYHECGKIALYPRTFTLIGREAYGITYQDIHRNECRRMTNDLIKFRAAALDHIFKNNCWPFNMIEFSTVALMDKLRQICCTNNHWHSNRTRQLICALRYHVRWCNESSLDFNISKWDTFNLQNKTNESLHFVFALAYDTHTHVTYTAVAASQQVNRYHCVYWTSDLKIALNCYCVSCSIEWIRSMMNKGKCNSTTKLGEQNEPDIGVEENRNYIEFRSEENFSIDMNIIENEHWATCLLWTIPTEMYGIRGNHWYFDTNSTRSSLFQLPTSFCSGKFRFPFGPFLPLR